MNKRRTGGITTIGVLNIVFGSLGAIVAVLMLIVGGLLAANSEAFDQQLMMETGGDTGGMAGTVGGFAIVIGLVLFVVWTSMAVAGIGVLKLAPWGRMLSIVCGAVLALFAGIGVVTEGFSVGNLGIFVYGALLITLFTLKPEWKAAFSPGTETAAETTDQDQFRAAA